MTDNLVELHDRSGRRFAELVAGVSSQQWHDNTPCSDWDVRALVQHLLFEQLWVPPMLDGQTIEQVGDRFDGDLMGNDASQWPSLVASAADAAHSAVARPGALEQTVHLSFGDASGHEYVTQLTADLAIHGWDLARATRQDDALDPEVVALLLPWTHANAGLLADSGMFAQPIAVGPGAPDDIRLLGLMGRKS
jgi:uncharacterized protein (TIGR03086 family)